MTNKKLIDYCNSHWDKVHMCNECPYKDTYCKQFRSCYGDTPLMNDIRNDGKFYTDEEIEYEMTNKKLIDHCNSFWGKKGHCADCPYTRTYCLAFFTKFGTTPFMENTLHEEEYYTDEEVEYEN